MDFTCSPHSQSRLAEYHGLFKLPGVNFQSLFYFYIKGSCNNNTLVLSLKMTSLLFILEIFNLLCCITLITFVLQLFDLLGFDHFELIQGILEHRSDIVHSCTLAQEKKILASNARSFALGEVFFRNLFVEFSSINFVLSMFFFSR